MDHAIGMMQAGMTNFKVAHDGLHRQHLVYRHLIKILTVEDRQRPGLWSDYSNCPSSRHKNSSENRQEVLLASGHF